MTASPLFEFALLSFISMFTMVNPIGVIPVYTAMTAKLSPQEFLLGGAQGHIDCIADFAGLCLDWPVDLSILFHLG